MRILARRVVFMCLNPSCPDYMKERRGVQYWNYKGDKWAFMECPTDHSRNLSVMALEEFYEFREG